MNRNHMTLGTPVILVALVGVVPPAVAQTALERLEDLVRRQAGPTEAEAPEAEVPEAENPEAGAARPATEEASQAGYLGVVVDDREDRGRGVRVLSTLPNGPGQKAGLEAGDLITGVGQTRVRSMDELAAALKSVRPGQRIALEVLRGDNPRRIDVTLSQPPPPVRPPAGAVPPAPADQEALLRELLRRIEALERRVEALERALQ